MRSLKKTLFRHFLRGTVIALIGVAGGFLAVFATMVSGAGWDYAVGRTRRAGWQATAAALGALPNDFARSERDAVYRAVVDSWLEHRAFETGSGALLVVVRETEWPENVRERLTTCQFSPAVAEARAELTRRNRSKSLIWRPLILRVPVVLASEADVPPETEWTDFAITFPGAKRFLQFSDVGFGGDKTRALVYFANYCPMCGSGYYVALHREANGWSVDEMCPVWWS